MRERAHTGEDRTHTAIDERDVPHHIAFLMTSLEGGGVERVILNLAEACVERRYQVDLLVCQVKGPYQNQVPEGVRVIELKPGSTAWLGRAYILAADPQGFVTLLRSVLLPLKTWKRFRHLPALSRYLRREQPDVLLSAMTHVNLMALWARRLAGVATRMVVSEHITNV